MTSSVPMLRLRGVGKLYSGHRVLEDINLDVQRGDVVALIGPSGSGKTTLLRCMNFLEAYDEGTVHIRGALLGWNIGTSGARRRESERAIAEVRAPVSMVFQQFNLWPHLDALGNVMAPLVLGRRMPRERAQQIAQQALDRVGMNQRAHHRPAQLSGGQQQRVGIARALAVSPEVMLLDEPTSALDPELVDEVLEVIQSLSRDGMTMVMVTHEMSFAAEVASRVVFMENGRIVQQGSPQETIRNPQIGRRIKHHRMLHGMTLRELAERSGCSESMLSKVERAQASPSFSVLHRVAHVLETNISELTAEDENSLSPILHASERPVVNLGHSGKRSTIQLERLIVPRRGQLLQGDIHIVAPGGHSEEPITHIGEELGLVLEGELELTLNGVTHLLGAGDSFYFTSDTPHSYCNRGEAPARVLWVNTPATF